MKFMVVSEWAHQNGNIHLSEQKDVIRVLSFEATCAYLVYSNVAPPWELAIHIGVWEQSPAISKVPLFPLCYAGVYPTEGQILPFLLKQDLRNPIVSLYIESSKKKKTKN